jgi:SH3 domain protein
MCLCEQTKAPRGGSIAAVPCACFYFNYYLMKSMIRLFVLAALGSLCTAWPVLAQAETVIVTDVLPINVRSGDPVRGSIVSAPKSGTRLTVLERKPGYIRIRTPKGSEGWVLSRFVQDEPVAREKLVAAETRRDKAVALEQELQALYGDLKQQHQKLEAQHQTVRERADNLALELDRVSAAAADTLKIQRNNQTLQEELRQAQEQGLAVQAQLDSQDSRRSHLMLGAGILLAGLLLGLIVPYLRPKRSGW